MTRARSELGLTLIELLVTMSLMVIILGATVTAFASFNRTDDRTRKQNDAQDQARLTTDTLARQLRNLASPSDYLPQAVDLAEPYDFVFQTVDAVKADGSDNDRNIKRVRYCLGPSANQKASLWRQTQTWTQPNPPPTFPSTASCPSGAWPTQQRLVNHVVNREENQAIFTYNSAQPTSITRVRTDLFVDINPGDAPSATKLTSGVFLRNQNRAPVAAFTATYTGTGRRVLLNGSASEDPEGHPLKSYDWYLTTDTDTPIASDIISYWEAPSAGTYTFILKVKDHADLEGEARGEGVVVP